MRKKADKASLKKTA